MVWQKRREIKGKKKKKTESKRDRVTELVSILHIIALLIFSQLELAVAGLTACGVVGGVCVCPYVCTHLHILLPLHWSQAGKEKEGAVKSQQWVTFGSWFQYLGCWLIKICNSYMTGRFWRACSFLEQMVRGIQRGRERFSELSVSCCLLSAWIINSLWEHVCKVMLQETKMNRKRQTGRWALLSRLGCHKSTRIILSRKWTMTKWLIA